MDWPDRIIARVRADGLVARAVVVGASGSTPRRTGAAIVLSGAGPVDGSLGGGDLERAVIDEAKGLLQQRPDRFWTRVSHDLTLGPVLESINGTCRILIELFGPHEAHALEKRSGPVAMRPLAGGAPMEWLGSEAILSTDARNAAASAVLSGRLDALVAFDGQGAPWFVERAAALSAKLHVYAGGPASSPLRRVLPGLPFDLVWIDTNDAVAAAAAAAPGTYHVVMTGSHALDYAVCRTLLGAGTFAYLGLIGSAKKRTRFAERLAADGIGPDLIGRLRCPIGLATVPGKEPAVIAVAVAGELVSVLRSDPS